MSIYLFFEVASTLASLSLCRGILISYNCFCSCCFFVYLYYVLSTVENQINLSESGSYVPLDIFKPCIPVCRFGGMRILTKVVSN